MILSLRHGFLFVRGRKVAGTSVEMALSTLCGPDDIASPMLPADEAQRQAMGGFCGNYSDDPRLERAYLQLVREGRHEGLVRPPARYKAHMGVAAVEARFGPLEGFRLICVERNPYARVISAMGGPEGFDMVELRLLRTVHLYRNAAGDLVAQPLRYETLEADLAGFAEALGVELPPLPHAKPGPLSNRFDPRAVFARGQLDAINAALAEEFEFGGYERH